MVINLIFQLATLVYNENDEKKRTEEGRRKGGREERRKIEKENCAIVDKHEDIRTFQKDPHSSNIVKENQRINKIKRNK